MRLLEQTHQILKRRVITMQLHHRWYRVQAFEKQCKSTMNTYLGPAHLYVAFLKQIGNCLIIDHAISKRNLKETRLPVKSNNINLYLPPASEGWSKVLFSVCQFTPRLEGGGYPIPGPDRGGGYRSRQEGGTHPRSRFGDTPSC